jgi:hypothetical protein
MKMKVKKPSPPSVKAAAKAVKKAVSNPVSAAAKSVKQAGGNVKKNTGSIARGAKRIGKTVKPSATRAAKAIKQRSQKGVGKIKKAAKKAGKITALAAPGARDRYANEIRKAGTRQRITRANSRNVTTVRRIATGSHVVRYRNSLAKAGKTKVSSGKKLLKKAKKTFSKPSKSIGKLSTSSKKSFGKKLKATRKTKLKFPSNVKGAKATCPLMKNAMTSPKSFNQGKIKIPSPSQNILGGIIGYATGGPIGAVLGAAGGKRTVDFTSNMARIIARRPVNIYNEGTKIAKDFISGLEDAGRLARQGKEDQALGKIFETTGKAVVQSVALPALESVSIIRDVAYAAATALGGRNLTEEEKKFVHEIFGDKINLTNVRITIFGGKTKELFNGRASVAGNSIVAFEEPLSSLESRMTFAHEMTHIYQDQNPSEYGTRGATREMICSYCSWSNLSVEDIKAKRRQINQRETQYNLNLDENSTWSELNAEQQGRVVELWQEHRELVSKQISSNPDPNLARLLKQAGFFSADPNMQAVSAP